MKTDIQSAKYALSEAKRSLRKGDHLAARRWAQKVLTISPTEEEAWLIMAAVASPQASLAYLIHALKLNPQSARARRGMHWAIQRYRKSVDHASYKKHIRIIPPTPQSFTTSSPAIFPWILILLLIIATFLVGFGNKPILSIFSVDDTIAIAQVNISKATRTPTPTSTFTPTPTYTFTPTPTDTPTPTLTYTPTETPTITPSNTPIPTDTPLPTLPPMSEPVNPIIPIDAGSNERWIDVNLTQQRAYAYEGSYLVNSFIVSTGTWQYPTVTGQYRIYVKYRFADMAGPGYYLPNVPYVMYFYKGYGLHGTYWHNNFGTPMSHGCINFTIDDSAWIYDFASVGTLVNIHY